MSCSEVTGDKSSGSQCFHRRPTLRDELAHGMFLHAWAPWCQKAPLQRSFSGTDGLTFTSRNLYPKKDVHLTHGIFKDYPLISDQQNASFLAMEKDVLTRSPSLPISAQTANLS